MYRSTRNQKVPTKNSHFMRAYQGTARTPDTLWPLSLGGQAGGPGGTTRERYGGKGLNCEPR